MLLLIASCYRVVERLEDVYYLSASIIVCLVANNHLLTVLRSSTSILCPSSSSVDVVCYVDVDRMAG